MINLNCRLISFRGYILGIGWSANGGQVKRGVEEGKIFMTTMKKRKVYIFYSDQRKTTAISKKKNSRTGLLWFIKFYVL